MRNLLLYIKYISTTFDIIAMYFQDQSANFIAQNSGIGLYILFHDSNQTTDVKEFKSFISQVMCLICKGL